MSEAVTIEMKQDVKEFKSTRNILPNKAVTHIPVMKSSYGKAKGNAVAPLSLEDAFDKEMA